MLVQVYVDDIIFGSTTQSMCTEFEDCMHKRLQVSSMGELTFFLGLQVKQQHDGIFISQDKYVADILKKFEFCSIKIATTSIVSNKPLVKDEDGVDVDVHVYKSMIGSLMYLTTSRPYIMFAVCACARFQVTPKASHLNAEKKIFRYLKHQPKLGLLYSRDSPFELKAFLDSDYGGANLDRKSTTGGCQFLGRRLISWQCKKQMIVANSTTEAEYVAAANCCGQILWIQNQMMDYGFNFMNTKIHIDNESTICIVKNHVYHSRTKHIEIRHHFIRDCYEKRLIDVIKIHTNANVVDLLTKIDVKRYVMLFGLRIKGLVSAAQKHLTMEMMFGLGKKMLIGLVLEAINVSMANLEFVDQHNMVACLEKTEGNSNFHEIVDFLASSSIHHALTVSPPIYTSCIEQFWNTANSQTINDVKQINATVDGTVCLTNEAIFQNLALMGYEAEGEGSGEPTEPQPTPSPTHPSIGDQPPVQTPHDSPLSGGHTSDKAEGALNLQELSVLCTNLSNRVLALESINDAQAAEISALKSRIKKLEKNCKPSISHRRAWLKSVNKLSMKTRFRKKESIMVWSTWKLRKLWMRGSKGETEEVKLTDDTEVVEDKGSGDKGGNAEELVSTARPEISTA
ncbi:putative ribonuclease H-like domain-containing protein [Tanacetum coccineum]|uniref:Ribonuclease H-like domain-containing protein n=1 Tax=Tanacetum coccineum TaxID=301880 RepID=A0ABQ5BNM7_9ASTR